MLARPPPHSPPGGRAQGSARDVVPPRDAADALVASLPDDRALARARPGRGRGRGLDDVPPGEIARHAGAAMLRRGDRVVGRGLERALPRGAELEARRERGEDDGARVQGGEGGDRVRPEGRRAGPRRGGERGGPRSPRAPRPRVRARVPSPAQGGAPRAPQRVRQGRDARGPRRAAREGARRALRRRRVQGARPRPRRRPRDAARRRRAARRAGGFPPRRRRRVRSRGASSSSARSTRCARITRRYAASRRRR